MLIQEDSQKEARDNFIIPVQSALRTCEYMLSVAFLGVFYKEKKKKHIINL